MIRILLKFNYNYILDQFFIENKIDRSKKVYKATEIASLFPGPAYQFRGILRRLCKDFIQLPKVNINVYYHTLNLKQLRERKVTEIPEDKRENKIEELKKQRTGANIIQIFGEPGREAMEYISVSDHFEKVRQYFPIVCVSKLCSFLSLKGEDIVLDGCTGYVNQAWNELINSGNNVTILLHGDSYNPYISVADMLVRWIDEELRQGGIPLNDGTMERILREWKGVTSEVDTKHIQKVHLGNRDLGFMKPLSKRTIQQFHNIYLRHPIFFVFQEGKEEVDRAFFENSPLFDLVNDQLYNRDGSYTWWDPTKHLKLIKQGDVAVFYGENGQREVDRLLELRYPIQSWNLMEIE